MKGSFVKLPIDEPVDGMAHDRGASIGLFEVTGDCSHIINKAGLEVPAAKIFSGRGAAAMSWIHAQMVLKHLRGLSFITNHINQMKFHFEPHRFNSAQASVERKYRQPPSVQLELNVIACV